MANEYYLSNFILYTEDIGVKKKIRVLTSKNLHKKRQILNIHT